MSLSERSKQNMTCAWWRDIVSKHSSNTFLVVGHQICTHLRMAHSSLQNSLNYLGF